MCVWSKKIRNRITDLLVPLQPAERPWMSVSVDFIGELPDSNGFNIIMIVMDWFTKVAHFTPCSTTIMSVETTSVITSAIGWVIAVLT